MRLSQVLLASFAIGTHAASAVVELLPKNFDDIVLKSGKPAFVEFFAPWCGHCKNLAPIWEELATNFEYAQDKVTIAKVDADANRDLGQRFGIQGFPTLKYFDGKSDKPEDYNGGRDLDALQEFVREKTGVRPKGVKNTSKVVMLNDATFNTTIGKDKHVLVAFTASWCGHCKALAPHYEKAAEDYANDGSVVIAKVDAEHEGSKRIAQEQGVTGYPTIKFFSAHSTEPETYTSGRTEDAILEFINSKAGLHRLPGGRLSATAGTIPLLDKLIQKFVDDGEKVGEHVEDVLVAAQKLTSQYGQYYSKVAEKIKKNEKYVEKELARLEKLLAKGSLAPEKLDDLTSRSNILRKFQVKKGDGKVDEVKADTEKSEL